MDNTSTAPSLLSAAPPVSPLLSIERVVKDYQTDGESVRALDEVTLQMESGEFVALVGRSGCGKSTLLHLAGAMDFPTSGHVRLDGVATDHLDEAQLTTLRREKVGFIFQSFQLLHTLSAIAAPAQPNNAASARNATSTTRRLAPRARRVPISARRRTTDTEMVL